ncbi:hypothetical protein HYX13_05115 [Candidatus Woesearchaeota archaeon]|nr:hypothetical protein [Candidatus Woesearchaeota archaeon]
MAENVPAGSPIATFYPTGDEAHVFLKGQGTDTIEAHVGTNEITIDKESLLNSIRYSSDSSQLLVTHPKIVQSLALND